MMTTSSSEYFRDNPWEGIDEPCYPNGRRLYLKDERFWVSMGDDGHYLFFVQDKGDVDVKPLQNVAGLKISTQSMADGSHRLVCRLVSDDPGLRQKFAIVAKDIAFHCSGFSGQRLFAKAQALIHEWSQFLRPSRSGLSNREFVGLIGELFMITGELNRILPPSDTIRAWIGPEGKKQDFTFDRTAIETKTTRAGDPKKVTITSLDQLDRVTDQLVLAHVVIAPCSEIEGTSLKKLYEACAASVEEDVVASALFARKASKLYGKASEQQLTERFEITRLTYYSVDENFPKLTRSQIAEAILEARYDISLAALRPYEILKDLERILGSE